MLQYVCYLSMKSLLAKTGLAQWIEFRSVDLRIPGLIPVKGMYIICGHIPGGGHAGGS